MRKTKTYLISLALCLSLFLCNLTFKDNSFIIVKSEEMDDSYKTENISELLNAQQIKSSEYLHNFDDKEDYLYVTFEDGGYAIFYRATMELLEYSLNSDLPYQNVKGIKYYGGPNSYMRKEGEVLHGRFILWKCARRDYLICYLDDRIN